jgi:protein-arginine kinase activator protein McsA
MSRKKLEPRFCENCNAITDHWYQWSKWNCNSCYKPKKSKLSPEDDDLIERKFALDRVKAHIRYLKHLHWKKTHGIHEGFDEFFETDEKTFEPDKPDYWRFL